MESIEAEVDLGEETMVATTDALEFERRGGKTLVVSPQTGGYVVTADAQLLRLLVRLGEGACTLGALLDGWPGEADDLTGMLVDAFERGIVSLDRHAYGTSSSRPGPRRLKILSPGGTTCAYPVLGIFHVHNFCNLACTYCYTIEEGVTRQRLSVSLMKSAVDELVSFPTRHSNIEFHGGEPTMAFDEIEQVVEYAAVRYKAARKPVSYSIQTNAYSLNPRMVSFFREHAFSVRVSLDGSKQTNDRFRISHGGRGSYERVVKGIRMLQEAGLNPAAVCVVHRGNVGRMVEMYESMAALGVPSVRFLPVFKTLHATEADWLDGDTYVEAYLELIRHMVTRAEEGRAICPLSNLISGELNSVSSFKREYMCMRGPCGAGTNMIALDVNGDIYPCEEMIGKPEFVIGNLNQDTMRSALENHSLVSALRSRHVDDIPECSTCTWKQLCHGGCVHKSYTHFKRLDRKSEHCAYYKRIYRELIWLDQDRPGAWRHLRGN